MRIFYPAIDFCLDEFNSKIGLSLHFQLIVIFQETKNKNQLNRSIELWWGGGDELI